MELAVYVTWLFYIILQVTVRGFSHHVSLRQLHKSIRPQTVVFSIPSTESTESANLEENTDDEDEDFAEMKREIELMLASSTDSKSPLNPISVTSVEEVGKYNKVIAVASALLGSFLFVFQHSQPVSGVALMHAMERDSVDINVAMCNGKPTVIDFYADWCESCKAMAPSMRSIESQYKDKVNFVTLDGSNTKNAQMVKRFRVDGIPHLAFIDSNLEVKTALVGAVPKPVLKDQILALLQGKPMPYEGYDAFEEESHFPMSDISKTCASRL